MTKTKYYVEGCKADGTPVVRWYALTENKAVSSPVFVSEETVTKARKFAIASNPAYRRLNDG